VGVSDIKRVPTGISGLDEVLGGGFPRGSLIILAGNPGTGKTIFSAIFLYNGIVNYGERGVYVSFAENREAFLSNMLSLGFNFEELEERDMFRFLDLVTAREEVAPAIMETVLREVSEFGAKRLVIDSFSAMAQAFKGTHEARIILHTILSRVIRLMGCTAILVVEVPYGENRMGLGLEEFVADGIILLRRSEFEGGRFLREMEILKMRGTSTPEARLAFTLKGGFKAFPPFKPKPIEKPSRFQPQPDTEEFFSSGSSYLDEMLEGGYPRGSTVLIEIDEHISTLQYHLITAPTAWNFGAQGRGIIILPSAGVDHNLLRMRAEEAGFTRDEINDLLRVCVKVSPELKPEPYVVMFRGESLQEDYAKYLEVEEELRERTGKPILHVTGVDVIVDIYGVKETVTAIKGYVTRMRETGDLSILLLKPGYPELTKILAATADIHLKITRKYGIALVHGIKPRTSLHVLEMDASMGYPMPKLTPII